VQLEGDTDFYVWGEKEIQFHRCKNCGCVTHWKPADPKRERDMFSVNCRILEVEDLGKFEIKQSPGPKGRAAESGRG
jgi:hypothetical protein